jgi:hypothetical protein
VKARFRPSLLKFRSAKPSLHPPVKGKVSSNEKRIPPCLLLASPSHSQLWPV